MTTKREQTRGDNLIDRIALAKKLLMLRGNRSREEIAKACKISVSALAMYELGERVPRDEIKIRLAKYYSVDIGTLFFANLNHKS